MKSTFLFGLALLSIAQLSLKADENEKPLIFVPVKPYEFLFEKIGGDLIDVQSIVGESDDPHSYTPTPKQIVKMSSADMICSGSLGFEANYFVKTGNAKGGGPLEINLLAGLSLLEGHCDHPSHQEEAEGGEVSDHDHDHSHDDLKDPHVWLSVKMLTEQSQHIAKTVKELLPPNRAVEIDANLAAFQKELKMLDEKLKTALEPAKGKRIYVYHGAFAYFAQDYGLEQIAIEEGNRTPTPKHVAEFATQAGKDGVKLIFTQPQFDKTGPKALADAIGGTVAVLDPLEKDIFANLAKIAEAIAAD